MLTAAEALVDLLARCGVRRFYTVPGESFLEVIDAVDQHPDLTLVSTRHESGAAFMAEADGKLTGVPAAAMATRAVGASNLAIGVHTALQDATPMVVLLGQVETRHLGKEAFQEVDLPAFYDEITTWGATAHRADRIAELGAEAFRRATSPSRPGPAVLALPADLLGEPGRRVDPPVQRWVEPAPGRAACEDVAGLLAQARAPVVVLGRGAYGVTQLVPFVERYGLGAYTAFRRQDAFPNEHASYLGNLAIGTPAPVLAPLRDADLVLVLGARLDEITTQGFTVPEDGQRVVHVDADVASLGRHRRVEVALVSTAASFVAGMLEVDGARDRDWSAAHDAYLAASDPSGLRSGDGGLHPAEVVAAMARQLPHDSVMVNDAGNFSAFAHRYWRFPGVRSQLGPTSGAMGYGVPGAVGAKLAAPDRRVVALAGDGGFLMTGVELETAVRVGVPITVVVFQNGLYGTIAMHQARASGRLAGVDIAAVDVVAFARSLGADAVGVERADELDDALACVDPEKVSVVCVRTDPDVISPSATLSGLTAQGGGIP